MMKKINILMVDDQPAKLLTYEVMLSDLDENLIKATSGKEALELLLKNDSLRDPSLYFCPVICDRDSSAW
jgi:CheY-like chemotaxis protein